MLISNMHTKYQDFIDRFSTLSKEELHYQDLYTHGYFPSVPDYIKEQKDLQHKESTYIPQGDIVIRKHPCFLPNYIHDHAFLEVPMVLRGSCKQRIYGEEFIMHEGDALIIAPDTYHSISVFDEKTTVINLLVKMEILPLVLSFETMENTPLSAFYDGLYNGTTTRNYALLKDVEEAFTVLPTLQDEQYRPVLLVNLALYFALLFKCRNYSFPIGKKGNNDRLTNILDFIRMDPNNATLSRVAESQGLSTGYLSMLIHEKTGLPFSSLVAKQKIQNACKLLSNPQNTSNMEIAAKLGMNPQQFSKYFKKWIGITPQQYRKSHLGETRN